MPRVDQGTIIADASDTSRAITSTAPLTNFFTLQATTAEIFTLSLHDALPICTLSVGTGSQFNLDGSLPIASIEGHLQNTGGPHNITPATNSTGMTFTARTTTGNVHLGSGGVIAGGTVTSTGGASLIIDAGTLS